MDGLLANAWYLNPAVAAMVLGFALLCQCVRVELAAYRGSSRSEQRLALLRGFRFAVVGFALIGLGAGLVWEIGWLWMLALIVGGEELLESSVLIAAVRDECRRLSAETVSA